MNLIREISMNFNHFVIFSQHKLYLRIGHLTNCVKSPHLKKKCRRHLDISIADGILN